MHVTMSSIPQPSHVCLYISCLLAMARLWEQNTCIKTMMLEHWKVSSSQAVGQYQTSAQTTLYRLYKSIIQIYTHSTRVCIYGHQNCCHMVEWLNTHVLQCSYQETLLLTITFTKLMFMHAMAHFTDLMTHKAQEENRKAAEKNSRQQNSHRVQIRRNCTSEILHHINA